MEVRLRYVYSVRMVDFTSISPEEFYEKIEYIHHNPVKRKLVMKRVDWKWSSAADYAKVRVGPLGVENQDLAWFQR